MPTADSSSEFCSHRYTLSDGGPQLTPILTAIVTPDPTPTTESERPRSVPVCIIPPPPPVAPETATLSASCELELARRGGLDRWSASLGSSSSRSTDGGPVRSVRSSLKSSRSSLSPFPPRKNNVPIIRQVCTCPPGYPLNRTNNNPNNIRRSQIDNPPMHVRTTISEHTLDVWLPEELSVNLLTLSTKRGDRLSVMADVWFRENGTPKHTSIAHYEWEISFMPADVNMTSIRASLSDGHVVIRAPRSTAGF